MEIKCTQSFCDQFSRLKRKKSYRDLEALLAKFFHEKEFKDLLSGARIHDTPGKPFIKKRLGGSGGYRLYYIADENEENIYNLVIYPKTGPDAQANITDAEKVECIRELVNAKKKGNLFVCRIDENGKELSFEKENL
ncbi:MAG: hypothetical protein R3B93_18400 [Bacteroidia bacterium]